MRGAVISAFAYFSFYSRTSKRIVVCSSHSLMMCSIEMVLLACCVVSKGFLAKVTVILFAHYQPRKAYTISKAREIVWLYKVVMSLCGHRLFDLYLFHILKWFIPPRPSRFSSCKKSFFMSAFLLEISTGILRNLKLDHYFGLSLSIGSCFSVLAWKQMVCSWKTMATYCWLLIWIGFVLFLVSISRRSWSLWVHCGKMVVHKEWTCLRVFWLVHKEWTYLRVFWFVWLFMCSHSFLWMMLMCVLV